MHGAFSLVWAVSRWLGDCFLILVLGSAEPNGELILHWCAGGTLQFGWQTLKWKVLAAVWPWIAVFNGVVAYSLSF